MKTNYILYTIMLAVVLAAGSACSKVLDKEPVTWLVRENEDSTITAAAAENLVAGIYLYYKREALEFSVFDRITNGDVLSDNNYAGGDNTANITLDNFRFNSLNGNLNRDWQRAYELIGRTNIALAQIVACNDPALTAARKSQMLAELRFFRAFTYFDLVRLFGRVPLILQRPDESTSETLLKSTIVPRSSVDSVYNAIRADLWFAKANAREVAAAPNKYLVSKGAVNATLAKVHAAMPSPNWDSVRYYCDQTIPSYSLVSDYNFLWDNNHKNSSEAIWEINFSGYNSGDGVGNWIPSIFVGGSIGNYEGGGWKKFSTPSNDLVALFNTESDNIRRNASIKFLDITGQFSDVNWPSNNYPFIVKFNDPRDGTNDFYMIRLPDIMLLKAEALVKANDVTGAMLIVAAIRARVSLGPKTAANAAAAETVIANERRLELAFEGHRWFDLVRTGKAVEVMNAQKGLNGTPLNYNVQPYRTIMPVPQQQIDLNPALDQNPEY
ncbi:RagB/SusD family nutrient uptake outer membrane protein [Filimonas effusa]|uniref:RagB/SusD family nutrient uptake outer membrane protein n=1 Tax=Filimonas effusa TaxID=2508721 RepID=A0A4Q1D8A8_9BACT|nr:RagB/SusD family nutrient uptake outer membrane protein [Filimonas effusa]RXK85430.1 RagB/SusD family nutrient uptake outer membrane protein [Filimonas effusa]